MTQWMKSPPSLIQKDELKLNLDFKPLLTWPESMPGLSVNSVAIAGFNSNCFYNHSLEWREFPQFLKRFYPNLEFVELSRLYAQTQSLVWFPFKDVLKAYNFSNTEMTLELLQKLFQTPLQFQNWCAEKCLSPADLAPLSACKDLNLNLIFLRIIESDMSKSQGVQFLELCIELKLMQHSDDALGLNDSKTKNQVESWVEQLRSLRYPQTKARDQQQSVRLSNLNWPGAAQVKWVRKGDKSGVEVRLFVSQSTDLEKYLRSLSRVAEEMRQTEKNT